jgi:mono/diheme cytochrome c family protein
VSQLLHKMVWALWIFPVFLAGSRCGFAAVSSSSNATNPADSNALAPNRVRSIKLPHFEPELPLAAGRDAYLVVCVGCHSPRYVTMQPFFAPRQWEETVDKMVKVYGAQIDQDQRSAVIQYLVATHGPASPRAPAGDQDSDFTAVTAPASPSETGPALVLATEGAERTKQIEHGAELFKQNCAGCHGLTGSGDGLIAPVLLSKPKNLAANRYSLELLSQVLWNGKRGTAMPSWRALPQPDLSALGAFVQSLHPFTTPEAATPESLQRGSQVFMQNCAPCHGMAGDGKGTAAAALIPQPANFKLKQPDFNYILQVLTDGVPGTGMPAWNQQIPEPDRRALAGFVRSLFQSVDSSKP